MLVGFSFVELVRVVVCDDDDVGGAVGLVVVSGMLNLGTFGKIDLVGVVVVCAGVFVIVVCDGGGGADVVVAN